MWFDAHLDLAYLAVNGRNMLAEPESAGGPGQPGCVTLPSLAEGDVRFALGTVFTERGGDGPEGYPENDAEIAHRRGRAQLEVYLTWRDEQHVSLDLLGALRSDAGVGEVRGGMGVSEVRPVPLERRVARLGGEPALRLGVLMESADPIRSPVELGWWVDRGLIGVGMAWWAASRYAGGNGTPEIGLTGLGRDLVAAMDELGVVHDLSHLSQKATDELLALTDAPVIASHSNCRALMDGEDERHLADETIREIGRRDGVVGLNLVSAFLDPEIESSDQRRAGIDRLVAHADRVCDLIGDRAHVGLGSDMDGGFPRTRLPQGIDGPPHLERIAQAITGAGWSGDEVEDFRWRSWARFFERVSERRQRRAPAQA